MPMSMIMNDKIVKKLETYTNAQLIDLISKLCYTQETKTSLELLVFHDLKLIKKQLSSFERWCKSYERNSYSGRIITQLYHLSNTILECIKYIEPTQAADILFKMYCATEFENEACYDTVGADLRFYTQSIFCDLISQNRHSFSDEDLQKYQDLLDY